MTTELALYRKQAGDIDSEHRDMLATLCELDTFTVSCDDDAAFAADMLREVKAKAKDLDERRKSVTQPLNATVKTINGWFKPALDALEAAEKKLKARVALYMLESSRRAQEALALAATAPTVEAATAALAASMPAAMPQGVSMRMIWHFRIVDESAVPVRFCSPDSAKIEAEMRGSAKDNGEPTPISGVEFFQEASMTVRR